MKPVKVFNLDEAIKCMRALETLGRSYDVEVRNGQIVRGNFEKVILGDSKLYDSYPVTQYIITEV